MKSSFRKQTKKFVHSVPFSPNWENEDLQKKKKPLDISLLAILTPNDVQNMRRNLLVNLRKKVPRSRTLSHVKR